MINEELIELIDGYAENRHVHGSAAYNVKTAASRRAVLDILEAQARETDRVKALYEKSIAVHAGTVGRATKAEKPKQPSNWQCDSLRHPKK